MVGLHFVDDLVKLDRCTFFGAVSSILLRLGEEAMNSELTFEWPSRSRCSTRRPANSVSLKYPGGWARCLIRPRECHRHRVWYDEHLFRDGAMSPGRSARQVARIARARRDHERILDDRRAGAFVTDSRLRLHPRRPLVNPKRRGVSYGTPAKNKNRALGFRLSHPTSGREP